MTVFDGADVALHRSTAVDRPCLLRILRLVSIVGNLRIEPTHCENCKTTCKTLQRKERNKVSASQVRYLSPIEMANETIDRTFYLRGRSQQKPAHSREKKRKCVGARKRLRDSHQCRDTPSLNILTATHRRAAEKGGVSRIAKTVGCSAQCRTQSVLSVPEEHKPSDVATSSGSRSHHVTEGGGPVQGVVSQKGVVRRKG